MKDTSGASIMDPATQVTSLHGVSMLDAAREPLEANLCLAVLRELNGPNDNKLANVAIAAHVNLFGDPMLAAADAARAAGNAPNSVIAAAVSILGPRRVDGARRAVDRLVDLFVDKVQDATDESGLAVLPADGEGFLGHRPRTPRPRRCSTRSRHAAPARSSSATCGGCRAAAVTSPPTRCWRPWP